MLSEPLTRLARSLKQNSQPPTATFEHSGEGVGVVLASAMIYVMEFAEPIIAHCEQEWRSP